MNKLVVGTIVLLLAGCKAMPNEESLDTFIIGDWQVESLMGSPVTGEPANLNFADGGKLFGNNSCNNFFGQYSLKGDQVGLIPGGSTRMMCPENQMRQADLIDKSMLLVTTAKVNTNKLELLDNAGKSVFTLKKI